MRSNPDELATRPFQFWLAMLLVAPAWMTTAAKRMPSFPKRTPYVEARNSLIALVAVPDKRQ